MEVNTANARPASAFQIGVVSLIVAAVVAYSVAVVVGGIKSDQKIDSAHLTLIFLAGVSCLLILRPQVLGRVGKFEGLGFKLELLQRLQDRQVEQAEKLYDLDMLVPLLFQDADRKHLINLVRGTTSGYHGGGPVRDELRRLRTIGLIRSARDRHIADLHSNTSFDLTDWVSLTDVGRRWAERLRRLDDAASEMPQAREAPPA